MKAATYRSMGALGFAPRRLVLVGLDPREERIMNFGNLLHWAIIFLVIAIIAALLGFGGLAGTAMEGARILFWVAIVLAVLAFLFNFMRGRA
jgi:uncharacterized membrane protein YtjA (UPF0391 family)